MRLFSDEIQKFIKENCSGVSSKKMAELLNKEFGFNYTKEQLKSYYGNHKIKSGLISRFVKGHTPQNKGKTGTWSNGCEKGWFKKGCVPLNHKPIGSERLDAKDGYTLIKTQEPKKWELKHKVLWESKNGKVPKGHVLIFLDNNKNNITLDNIKLITKAESLELNRSKLRSSVPEFTETGLLITKVRIAQRRVTKNEHKAQG